MLQHPKHPPKSATELVQYDQCYVFLQDMTALHIAAWKGSNKVITFLIDHGAGVNNIDKVSYHHNIAIDVAT